MRKFLALMGHDTFEALVQRIQIAGPLEDTNGFLFGQGIAPHMGGWEEAAFAVTPDGDRVFAGVLTEGKSIDLYGVASSQELPEPLKAWYVERGRTLR